MSEWKEFKVEEIKADDANSLATGPFGSSISSKFFTESGIPVIRGKNLSQSVSVKLDEENFVFVSEIKAKEFQRSIVKEGDLIFTCWGTINQVGYIDKNANYKQYVISNKQMKLTPNMNMVNGIFLYYLFSSPAIQHKILNSNIGSSVPGFNLGQLRNMKLRLPSLNEQNDIVDLLSSFDQKITLLQHQNQTLEKIAQTLFKHWFIEFEFPNEDGKPYQSSGGAMQASEFGEIPEGWSVKKIKEVADLNPKSISKTSKLEFIEYLDTGSITKGVISSFQKHTLKDAPSRAKRVVRKGDIVYSLVRPNQLHYGILKEVKDNTIVSTGFCVISCNDIDPHFIYLQLTQKSIVKSLHQIAEGSTSAYPSLKPSDIGNLEFILPSQPILEKFGELAESVWGKINLNLKQIKVLEQKRDTLLPKLMSGQIRIKDFEKEIT